jgi:hypothetical protein
VRILVLRLQLQQGHDLIRASVSICIPRLEDLGSRGNEDLAAMEKQTHAVPEALGESGELPRPAIGTKVLHDDHAISRRALIVLRAKV